MITKDCFIRESHMPHRWVDDKGVTWHCPGLLFPLGEPTSKGKVRITAEDGEEVVPTAGTVLKLDSGLMLVIMTQDDYNRWEGTASEVHPGPEQSS